MRVEIGRTPAEDTYEPPRAGDWRDGAACLDADPEIFFPLSETSKAFQVQIQEAKAFCGRCAVRQECLSWAIESGQADGIAGGLTALERRELKTGT